MRRKIEMCLLYALEFLAKTFKAIGILLALSFLYGTPILLLLYDDNSGSTSDTGCWIWIIALHGSTVLSLLFNLYLYLCVKYKNGKVPKNSFTSYMLSESHNMYFE